MYVCACECEGANYSNESNKLVNLKPLFGWVTYLIFVNFSKSNYFLDVKIRITQLITLNFDLHKPFKLEVPSSCDRIERSKKWEKIVESNVNGKNTPPSNITWTGSHSLSFGFWDGEKTFDNRSV